MPIYEYACSECNSSFELLVRGGESPACPTCHSAKLEKLLSVPAAHTGGLPLADRDWPGPCGMGGCGRPECE